MSKRSAANRRQSKRSAIYASPITRITQSVKTPARRVYDLSTLETLPGVSVKHSMRAYQDYLVRQKFIVRHQFMTPRKMGPHINPDWRREAPFYGRSVFGTHIRGLENAIRNLEDRRRWHPDRSQPAAAVRTADRRIYARGTRVGEEFGFANPMRVSICIRRKQRKEVLFANRKTGKGAKAWRRKRTKWSDYKC